MSQKTKAIVVGNFNVLHPGHVRLLKFAKSIASQLVVGVYDDEIAGASVEVHQDLRLEAVSSIECVDETKIVSTSLKDFLCSERPDFVVKGKEFENEINVEQEVLDTFGGQLLFSSGEMNLKVAQEESQNMGLPTGKKAHIQQYLEKHGTRLSDINHLIEQFTKKKVCVVGDLIVDEYIDCFPLGMSQEEPTIVVSQTNSKKFVGGAGIVASHASQLGANVHLICVTGHDQERDFVAKELDANDVKYHFVIDEARPTTVKQRFRSEGRSLFRVSKLSQQAISAGRQQAIYDHFSEIVKDLDLLVFSDFNYGMLSQELVEDIIVLAKEKKVLTVADSQSSSQYGDISRFVGAKFITPTEREARLAIKDFSSGLVTVAEKLRIKVNADFIFITLGHEGVLIHQKEKKQSNWQDDLLPAMNLSPRDPAGAGDALFIVSALSLACGSSIWEAAYLGSIAAACQVGKLGNIPLTKKEILIGLKI